MIPDNFLAQCSERQAAVVEHLHELLSAFPNIQCKVRYRVPFYYQKSWICYLNRVKHDAIEMCFLRGCDLSNAQGLLDAKGRKQVSGITFASVADIDEVLVLEVFAEALLLDEGSVRRT